MEIHINNYKKQHGRYPEIDLAYKIYGTRKKRKMLIGKGIAFSGKAFGRLKKETEENKNKLKEQRRQAKADHCGRISVEGNLGHSRETRISTG